MRINLTAADWWRLCAPLLPVLKPARKIYPYAANDSAQVRVIGRDDGSIVVQATATDMYVIIATEVTVDPDAVADRDDQRHLIPEQCIRLLAMKLKARKADATGILDTQEDGPVTATITTPDGSQSITSASGLAKFPDLWAKIDEFAAAKTEPTSEFALSANVASTLIAAARQVVRLPVIHLHQVNGDMKPISVTFLSNSTPGHADGIRAVIMPARDL